MQLLSHRVRHAFARAAAALVVAGFVAAALPAGLARAAEAKLTFLLVNDIYKIDGDKKRGGFSRLAAIARAEKAKGGTVVYVHAGDTISPSLMSGFDRGAHIVEILNIVPPDVFVPGNHEFDFGPQIFRERMAALKSPHKLAANLREPNGEPVAGFKDSSVIEVDGVKIGIVGVTADDSPNKSSPGDLKFTDLIRTATAEARKLKSGGVDFVVLVAHANRVQDFALIQSGAFDLILSGDDHDLALMFDGRTAMVESKEEGEYVTAVDLTINAEDRSGRRTVTWWPNFRIMDSATVAPDPETEARVETYRKELSRELDVEIAKLAVPLDSRSTTVRTGEAAIGNLIADGMRWATGADIAITNGGGIRGNKQYVAGAPFSRRDVLVELPFGNRTLLLADTGDTILAALENGLSQLGETGGRFPQISGATVEVDKSKPVGSRVVSVKIGGEPLDPKKTYKIAINDFMGRGGDNYRMFIKSKPLLGERDSKLMANDVMAYVKERGTVDQTVQGRIVIK